MLPAVVLAALIASGLFLSKRDAVSSAPEQAPERTNPYQDPGMVAASRRSDAIASARAMGAAAPVQPRTVYSPLRGVNVPVEDMVLNLQPFYTGAAKGAGPLRERDPAAVPDPKREVIDNRGWHSQEKVSMEDALNMESYGIAGALGARRDGELLMQPVRQAAPHPEGVARVLPPTVDDLRGAAKPRYIDTGRVVAGGSPVSRRTATPVVPKRTAESFKVTSDADMLPNSGAATRATTRPDQIVLAATARGLGASNYMSHASASSRWTGDTTSASRDPRYQAPSLPIGPAGKAGSWNGGQDMSVSQYVTALRDNERNTLPNGGTALPIIGVKAAPGSSYVTPEQDRTDWNAKVVTTGAARIYGNMRGAVSQKLTMHDPNMVAPTTIKETLIHDTSMGIAGPRADRVQARSPDSELEATIRNTLAPVDSNANLAPPVVKPVVYDPDDIFEPTHRDTMGDADRTGNPDTMEDGQGYMTADVEAPNTQRQFQHTEYTGIADAEGGDGYRTADVDARNTQRQFIGDSGTEFGPGGSVNHKKNASYASMYAARIRSVKESILHGRAPTLVGPTLTKGSQDENLRMESSRDPYMEFNTRQAAMGRQGAVQSMVQPECTQDTRRVNGVRQCNDRHDGFTETSALRNNPYNLDVTRESAPPVMLKGVH